MKMRLMVVAIATLPIMGCTTNDQLMFISRQTLGVQIGIGAESPPVTFSIGYSAYDGAMMPALARKTGDGEIKVIQGRHHYCASSDAANLKSCLGAAADGAKGGLPPADADDAPQNGLVLSEDALSVVSSFGSDNQAAQSSNSVSSKLGKIFATGVSAQRISEGLKAELSYANTAACIVAINAGGFDVATKVELIKAKC